MSSGRGSAGPPTVTTSTDISYAVVLPRSPTAAAGLRSPPQLSVQQTHTSPSTLAAAPPPLLSPTPSTLSSSTTTTHSDNGAIESRRASHNSLTFSSASEGSLSGMRRHSFDNVALSSLLQTLALPETAVKSSSRRTSGHLSDASFDMSPTLERPATAPLPVAPEPPVHEDTLPLIASVQAVLNAAPLSTPWADLDESKAYYLPRNALLISDPSLPSVSIVAALQALGWTVDPMALSISDACAALSDLPPSSYQLVIVSADFAPGSSEADAKPSDSLLELAQTISVLTEYPTTLAVATPAHQMHVVGSALAQVINELHANASSSVWPEDQPPVTLSVFPAPPSSNAEDAAVSAWINYYAASWNQTNIRNGHLHFAISHRANFVTLIRALDSAGDAIKLLNTSGVIEYANQEFCIMTGVPVPAIIGVSMADLFKGHNEHLWQEIWATISAGDVWRGSITTSHLITKAVIHQSFTIAPILVASKSPNVPDDTLSGSTSPSMDNKQDNYVLIEGFVVVIRDVTSSTRALKDERYNTAQASEKHRFLMSTVNETIHDLRNEVMALSHYTNIVETAVKAGSVPSKEAVSSVVSTVSTLHETMTHHLDINKALEGKLTLEVGVVSMQDVMESALELTGPSAHGAGTELCGYVCPSVPPKLRGDTYRIRQVIHNLLTNAIKFTRRGTVSISAFLVESVDGAPIAIPPISASKELLASLVGPIDHSSNSLLSEPSQPESWSTEVLVVRVADTGIGIKPEALPNLFKPFSTIEGVTNKHGGSGLGLSICKQVVELMGGSMTVSSVVGQGTEFIFSVPVGVAHRTEARLCPSGYPDPIPVDGVQQPPKTDSSKLVIPPSLNPCSPQHPTPSTPRTRMALQDTHVICVTNSDPTAAWVRRALADIGTGNLSVATTLPEGWQTIGTVVASAPATTSVVVLLDSACFIKQERAPDPTPPRHPFSRRASVIQARVDMPTLASAQSSNDSSSEPSFQDVVEFVSALRQSPSLAPVPIIIMTPIGDELGFEAAHGFTSTYVVVKPIKQSLLPSVIVNATREAKARTTSGPRASTTRRMSLPRGNSLTQLTQNSQSSGPASTHHVPSATSQGGLSDLRRASLVTNHGPRRTSVLGAPPDLGALQSGLPAPPSLEQLYAPRVLLVDDSNAVLKIGERTLTKLNVKVTTASSGRDALTAFDEWHFDLVFLDVFMPGMSGLETAKAIRAAEAASGSSPVPIIALTGATSPDDQHAVSEAGMVDFIAKPFKSSTMEAVLRAHLPEHRLEQWRASLADGSGAGASQAPQNTLSPTLGRAKLGRAVGARTQVASALSQAMASGGAASGSAVAKGAAAILGLPDTLPMPVIEGVSESRSPRLGTRQLTSANGEPKELKDIAPRRHAFAMPPPQLPMGAGEPPSSSIVSVMGNTAVGGAVSFGQSRTPDSPLFASRSRASSTSSTKSGDRPRVFPRARSTSNASNTSSP